MLAEPNFASVLDPAPLLCGESVKARGAPLFDAAISVKRIHLADGEFGAGHAEPALYFTGTNLWTRSPWNTSPV
jgi:hypothetical protein